MRHHTFIGVLVCLVLGACAQTPARPVAAGAVPIYDATQIALDRYRVIKRIGVDEWESAFRTRGHRDLESAQRAIVTAASQAGADGVINLTCFDKGDAMLKPDGYFCYGNAIALNDAAKK